MDNDLERLSVQLTSDACGW